MMSLHTVMYGCLEGVLIIGKTFTVGILVLLRIIDLSCGSGDSGVGRESLVRICVPLYLPPFLFYFISPFEDRLNFHILTRSVSIFQLLMNH